MKVEKIKGLEEVIKFVTETKEVTTAEQLYEAVSKDYQEDKVAPALLGIRGVKRKLVDVLKSATEISKRGNVPIILIVGPVGSGKSTLIQYLANALEKEGYFAIDSCSYRESPFNALRSPELQALGVYKENRLPKLCSACSAKFVDGENEQAISVSYKRGRRYIKATSLQELLSDSFFIKANRGILEIEAETSVNSQDYKSIISRLLQVFDNQLFTSNAEQMPLDMIIIIHSLDRSIISAEALEDRVIPLYIRRNLSYGKEITYLKRLGFNVTDEGEENKHSIYKLLSKSIVLTRVGNIFESIYRSYAFWGTPQTKFDAVLELLNLFDSTGLNSIVRKSELFSASENLMLLPLDYLSSLEQIIGCSDVPALLDRGLDMDRILEDCIQTKLLDAKYSGISDRSLLKLLSGREVNSFKSADEFVTKLISDLVPSNEHKELRDAIITYKDAYIRSILLPELELAMLSLVFGDEISSKIFSYVEDLANNEQSSLEKDFPQENWNNIYSIAQYAKRPQTNPNDAAFLNYRAHYMPRSSISAKIDSRVSNYGVDTNIGLSIIRYSYFINKDGVTLIPKFVEENAYALAKEKPEQFLEKWTSRGFNKEDLIYALKTYKPQLKIWQ
jgi:energy-coupling factor transporter ATP-binding protein EcfA2